MRHRSYFALISFLLLLLSCVSFAQLTQNSDLTIKDARFTPYVLSGEKVHFDYLEDHIVVVHMWTAADQFIQQDINRLISLYKQYHDKGVIVIGAYVIAQGEQADYARIWKYAQQYRIPYSVVPNFSPPKSVTQVPHTFVFDAGGKLAAEFDNRLVLNNNFYQLTQVVKQLVANYPAQLVLGEKKLPDMRSEIRQLQSMRNLGTLYKRLQREAKGGSPDHKEQAEYFLKQLSQFALRKKQELLTFKTVDPLSYPKECQKFIRTWRGHRVAERIKDELDSLRRDKSFRKLLDAAQKFEEGCKYFYSMKPVDSEGVLDFSDPKFIRKNANLIRKAKSYFDYIVKKHGTTKYSLQARQFLEQINKAIR